MYTGLLFLSGLIICVLFWYLYKHIRNYLYCNVVSSNPGGNKACTCIGFYLEMDLLTMFPHKEEI